MSKYYKYTQNQHTAAGDALTVGAPGDGGTTTVLKRFLAGIDLDRFNHSSDTLLSGCVAPYGQSLLGRFSYL